MDRLAGKYAEQGDVYFRKINGDRFDKWAASRPPEKNVRDSKLLSKLLLQFIPLSVTRFLTEEPPGREDAPLLCLLQRPLRGEGERAAESSRKAQKRCCCASPPCPTPSLPVLGPDPQFPLLEYNELASKIRDWNEKSKEKMGMRSEQVTQASSSADTSLPCLHT